MSICRNCCFCSRVIVQTIKSACGCLGYVGKSTENFCRKKGSPIRKKHTHKPRVVCVCLIENRHKTIITQPIDRAAPSAVCPSPPSDIVCSTSPFSHPPFLGFPPSVFFSPPIPPPVQLYFHPRKTQKKGKFRKNHRKSIEPQAWLF